MIRQMAKVGGGMPFEIAADGKIYKLTPNALEMFQKSGGK